MVSVFGTSERVTHPLVFSILPKIAPSAKPFSYFVALFVGHRADFFRLDVVGRLGQAHGVAAEVLGSEDLFERAAVHVRRYLDAEAVKDGRRVIYDPRAFDRRAAFD